MKTRPITFSAEMMVQAAVEKFLNSRQLGGPVVDGGGVTWWAGSPSRTASPSC